MLPFLLKSWHISLRAFARLLDLVLQRGCMKATSLHQLALPDEVAAGFEPSCYLPRHARLSMQESFAELLLSLQTTRPTLERDGLQLSTQRQMRD